MSILLIGVVGRSNMPNNNLLRFLLQNLTGQPFSPQAGQPKAEASTGTGGTKETKPPKLEDQLNPLQDNVLKIVKKVQKDQVTEAMGQGVPAENILQQLGIPNVSPQQLPPTTPFTKSGVTPGGNVQMPGFITRIGQAGLSAMGAQDPNVQATNTQLQLLELLAQQQKQQQAQQPSNWDIHKEAENQALAGLGGTSWLGLDEEARKQYYPAILERENQIRVRFGKPPLPAMEYKEYLGKVREDIKAKVDALEKPAFVNSADWNKATTQQKKEFLNKLFGGR